MPQTFSFQDCHAPPREWKFQMTAAAAERIKLATDGEIDLLAHTPAMLEKLYTNQRVLITCIWALLGPQTEEKNVSFDSFVEGLDGTVLRVMKERFWRSLEDFFPDLATLLRNYSSTQLALMRELDQAMNKMSVRQRSLVLERFKIEADTALDRAAADNQAAKQNPEPTNPDEPGTTSSGSEPSSGSTGEPTPTASSSSPGKRTSRTSGTSPPSSSPTSTTPSPSSATSSRRSRSKRDP